MKKGFTLMELLVVIVIVGVVSVSSIISFANIKDSTAVSERKNLYLEIQRAAQLYLDFNEDALSQLVENKYTSVSVGTLAENNYVSSDLYDPVTNESMIREGYFVGLYIDNISSNGVSGDIVNTFIYVPGETIKCIANGKGEVKDLEIKKENGNQYFQ